MSKECIHFFGPICIYVQSPSRHPPVRFHKGSGGYLCIYESGLCWREEILKILNTEKKILAMRNF